MDFLEELDGVLRKRKQELPDGSYSTKMFKSGLDRILRKIGEEAGEVIIAGKNKNMEEIKNETADLLFHMMLHLRFQGISIAEVVRILKERHK